MAPKKKAAAKKAEPVAPEAEAKEDGEKAAEEAEEEAPAAPAAEAEEEAPAPAAAAAADQQEGGQATAEAEDADMKVEDAAEEGQEAEEAPAKSVEREVDAAPVKGPQIKAGSCTFHTEDTTLNVMQTGSGKHLMSLTDGGFQYLLAGARASVGLKAGRYMFEVMITECKNPGEPSGSRVQGPKPKNFVRVGFASEGSSLLLADGPENVCFDSEGFFVHGKMRSKGVSQKFGHSQVVAVLLNLDSSSPNANTISLFRDGERISEPQAIPEALRGKALYPAVTYRNVTLQVNFGREVLRPLPFKCLTLEEATVADSVVQKAAAPTDGKWEVVVPVGLPDEGTFDWLDGFMAKHRGYVELSDRALLEWAQKSGLQRQGGFSKRSNNDKPELNFGLALLDDYGVQKVIAMVAPMLPRNYVVMEVKHNLLEDGRKKLLDRFSSHDFRKVAHVAVGEPPAEFKASVLDRTLKEKQANAEAAAKRRKAEAAKKRLAEEAKKKREADQKRKEAARKAKEAKDASKEDGEGAAEAEEEAKEEDVKMEEVAEEKEQEEEVQVELTEEEKERNFFKRDTPDLAQKELATSYMKFSLPKKEEGFDDIVYAWQGDAECQGYLASWIQDRKVTQRVEELQPSEWFKSKLGEWQKLLNAWKKKQQESRDASAKRKVAAGKKKAAEEKKKGAEDGDGETKEEDQGEEEVKEEPFVEINADDLDVWNVEDVTDIGNGEPLFAHFTFEDWALLSLRAELHLLVHAFRHDLNDPERPAFLHEHVPFYYGRYYKKSFSVKNFGASSFPEVVDLIKDTIEIAKNSTLESNMDDDTPMDNFAKLTEDHRRERQRRCDIGDESAILKFPRGAPAPVAGGGGGKGNDRGAAAGRQAASGRPTYGGAGGGGGGGRQAGGGRSGGGSAIVGASRSYGGSAAGPASSRGAYGGSGGAASGYGQKRPFPAPAGGDYAYPAAKRSYGAAPGGAYGAGAYGAPPPGNFGGMPPAQYGSPPPPAYGMGAYGAGAYGAGAYGAGAYGGAGNRGSYGRR